MRIGMTKNNRYAREWLMRSCSVQLEDEKSKKKIRSERLNVPLAILFREIH